MVKTMRETTQQKSGVHARSIHGDCNEMKRIRGEEDTIAVLMGAEQTRDQQSVRYRPYENRTYSKRSIHQHQYDYQ
jgi:hypothetical protein